MRRIAQAPRAAWQEIIEQTGLTYHRETNHWFEEAAYEFTAVEVDQIEATTSALHELCLQAVDYIAAHPEELAAFCIPPAYQDYVLKTWQRDDPYFAGRFDLGFDPATGIAKLLEYNADTPTLMIETALTQWYWLQDKRPDADQFNSLHEKLLAQFQKIATLIPAGQRLYFTAIDKAEEELQHSVYLIDLAEQAGIAAEFIALSDIGWRAERGGGAFVDLRGGSICFLHKFYPWEWMVQDSFGSYVTHDTVGILEPAWKMILSNKAILPLLWRLFPGHENLLPCFHDVAQAGADFIAKPILAREGANVTIVRGGATVAQTGGTYDGAPLVYQHYTPLPQFDGFYAVIGSWMVGAEPAGMIVRESSSPITGKDAQVLPHYFL